MSYIKYTVGSATVVVFDKCIRYDDLVNYYKGNILNGAITYFVRSSLLGTIDIALPNSFIRSCIKAIKCPEANVYRLVKEAMHCYLGSKIEENALEDERIIAAIEANTLPTSWRLLRSKKTGNFYIVADAWQPIVDCEMVHDIYTIADDEKKEL